MDQNSEAGFFEAVFRQSQEQAVLVASAGESRCTDSFIPTDTDAGRNCQFREEHMEEIGKLLRIFTQQPSFKELRKECVCRQMAGVFVKRKRLPDFPDFLSRVRDPSVFTFLRISLRGKFQLDRSLSLVCGFAADSQHGADAVKEAPCAGRCHCLQLFFRHHSLDFGVLRVADGKLIHDGKIVFRRVINLCLLTFFRHRRRSAVQRALVPAIVPDHGSGYAPSLPGGAVSADLGKRSDAVLAFKSMIVGGQDLTSPDGPVRSVSGTVKRDADHFFGTVVFRHAGQYVRVMVLDADQGDVSLFRDVLRHHGRIVLWMQVTDHSAGCDFQQSFHPFDGFLKSPHSAQVFQVPHVRGKIKKISGRNTEGVFEFSADCQDTALHFFRQKLFLWQSRRFCPCIIRTYGIFICSLRIFICSLCLPVRVIFRCEQDGQWRVSAGAPDHVGFSAMEIHDGVVGTDADHPVVAEDTVAEGRQLRKGVIVIPADRCPGHISTGHYQAVGHLQTVVISKEKVLQGGIGKHDSHLGVAGRHRGRQERASPRMYSM